GAILGIPGPSGQAANVITKPSTISGRFDYRATYRPQFAKPSWIGGEVSVSGTDADIEWTLALSDGVGRGAGGGPAWIFDGAHHQTENRTILIHNEFDSPRIAGKLKWNGPGGAIANLNASYTRNYSYGSTDENRDLLIGD